MADSAWGNSQNCGDLKMKTMLFVQSRVMVQIGNQYNLVKHSFNMDANSREGLLDGLRFAGKRGDKRRLRERRFQPPKKSPDYVTKLIDTPPNSEPSRHFVNQVKLAISTLPVFLRQLLLEAGYRVPACHDLIEYWPELKGIRPRGWRIGGTWNHSPAIHSQGPPAKIVMAEWREDPSDPEMLLSSKNIHGVFRHEAGHALDVILKMISETKAFSRAYMRDYRKLSWADRERFHYFIQKKWLFFPTKPGKSEAFADAFATLYGGGCEKSRDMKQYFSHTVAFVRQAIQQLAEETRLKTGIQPCLKPRL
jgi:hypothetical protein